MPGLFYFQKYVQDHKTVFCEAYLPVYVELLPRQKNERKSRRLVKAWRLLWSLLWIDKLFSDFREGAAIWKKTTDFVK